MQPTPPPASDAANLLLFLFCGLPLLLSLIGVLVLALSRLPRWRRASQARKADEERRGQGEPQEKTGKGKEGEGPVIHVTWDGLAKWYLEEGHSIDGVTPLNAIPTMKAMILGTRNHPRTRLQQIPLERKRSPFPSPSSSSSSSSSSSFSLKREEPEPEEEEEESEEQEALLDDEALPTQDASFPLAEAAEEEEEAEVLTPALFPIWSLPQQEEPEEPVGQQQEKEGEVPFKDLATHDPLAFQEEVMLVYQGALQKQEEQPEKRLTRAILGIQGARWKALFSNPDGLFRRGGFLTDVPGGGFTLSPETERLSLYLQNEQQPGKEGARDR